MNDLFNYIDDSKEYKSKLKPFKHQDEMFERGLSNNNYAFFCEMGTGKSKVIADIIGYKNKTEGLKKVLIVAPKSLLFNWGRELENNIPEIKKFENPIDIKSFLCYNVCMQLTLKKKIKLLSLNMINIINYDALLNTPISILKDYDMIILDESSKVKNPKAKRTKLLIEVGKDIKYKYILSGTPITNNPIDIYSQMEFLDKSILHFKNFYTFKNYYCRMGGYMNYQIVGYNHLGKLKSDIAKASIQITKEDAGLNLPAKNYIQHDIDMSKEMTRQYKSMKDELILELEDEKITAQIALTKLIRLQEILSGKFLTDKKDNNKLKVMSEIIEEIPEDKQIIIFCRFIKSIEILKNWVKDLGFTASVIHGDVKDRQEQVDNFQNGTNRFFIGQVTTAGFGITLTNASYCVYYENNFSLEDRKQSEDRCHRIGLDHPVTYIDISYNKSLENHILKVVKGKEKRASYLVESFKSEA